MRNALTAIVSGAAWLVGAAWSIGALYFIYIAAHLSHWVWFIICLAVPPVPYIGFLLYAAGLIWQPQDTVNIADPRNAAEARTYFDTFVKMQAKCDWEEFSEKDVRLARQAVDHFNKVMTDQGENVFDADRSSTAIVAQMRCDGPEHFGFVRMIQAIRTHPAY